MHRPSPWGLKLFVLVLRDVLEDGQEEFVRQAQQGRGCFAQGSARVAHANTRGLRMYTYSWRRRPW